MIEDGFKGRSADVARRDTPIDHRRDARQGPVARQPAIRCCHPCAAMHRRFPGRARKGLRTGSTRARDAGHSASKRRNDMKTENNFIHHQPQVGEVCDPPRDRGVGSARDARRRLGRDGRG